MPSISPANIESWNVNKYYKTDEEYRTAICDAMRVEYKAIVDAGFILQIDDPRLITYYMMQPDLPLKDYPQVGEHAGRGAELRAARHSGGENPLSHLLQRQHGAARRRHAREGHSRYRSEDQSRRIFVRSVEPAP